MHIGQSAFEAVVIVSEALVVQAEEVEDGGVEIVDGGDVLFRLPAECIRGAMGMAALDAGAGEPGGKAFGVVVAAAGAFLESRHAAELSAPHDQRVLEQTALFEVAQQGGGGLVEHGTVLGVLLVQHLVSVPVADAFAASLVGTVEKLHKAHAFFEQAASEDTVLGKAGLDGVGGIVGAVGLEGAGFLGGKIADFGHAELHARGELIAGNAGGQLGVAWEFFQVPLVQALKKIARGKVGLGTDAGRACEVAQRFAGVKVRALKRCGQKAGAPVVDAALRRATRIGDGHVGGQFVIGRAKCPRHPRAHAREAFERVSGGHEILSRPVRVRLSG